MPTDKESAFFTFLDPLGVKIWLATLGAFFMAGFTIYALAKFTPCEWVDLQPWKVDKNKKLVNKMNMSNAFWFAAGTLLRQGTGVSPQVFDYLEET